LSWDARGLYEEAAAWTGRVQAATEQPGGAPPPLDTPAGSLWLFITGSQANRQRAAGRPDQAAATHQQILDMLGAQPPTRQRQADIAAACHNLGDCAQDRGRLDEADDWYRQSLAIEEDLGNRPGMADSYYQLGITAHLRGRLDEAEDWYRKAAPETIDDQPSRRRGPRGRAGRGGRASGRPVLANWPPLPPGKASDSGYLVGGPVSSSGLSGSLWQAGGFLVGADSLEEPGQVGGGELPVEGPGGLVVTAGEGQQGGGEMGRGGEVAG
jgi:tetratricopeptide (TPR) repeat protein